MLKRLSIPCKSTVNFFRPQTFKGVLENADTAMPVYNQQENFFSCYTENKKSVELI